MFFCQPPLEFWFPNIFFQKKWINFQTNANLKEICFFVNPQIFCQNNFCVKNFQRLIERKIRKFKKHQNQKSIYLLTHWWNGLIILVGGIIGGLYLDIRSFILHEVNRVDRVGNGRTDIVSFFKVMSERSEWITLTKLWVNGVNE